MTRDPRTDPRAGDCIRRVIGSEVRRRTVLIVKDGLVLYDNHSMMDMRPITLQAWQSWSRDAEIVRVG